MCGWVDESGIPAADASQSIVMWSYWMFQVLTQGVFFNDLTTNASLTHSGLNLMVLPNMVHANCHDHPANECEASFSHVY